jgi:hypothetical protein
VAVELFSAPVSKPDAIFCDTSFILDILTDEVAQIATLLGVSAANRTRAAESAAFFHTYRGYGAQFISSAFTFAEVGHVISRKVHRAQGYDSWKRFFNADQRECRRIYGQTMRLILTAWTRIEGYDVWFVLPEGAPSSPYGARSETDVVEAARLLKQSYMDIDWNDAYHIAVGLACGTDWFATLDQGWKSVRVINVFCDS